MTGRLQRTFAAADHPLLVSFVVAGDPDRNQSIRIARAIIEHGSDIIEIGIPFSDPCGDGPTIQRGDQRALLGGATPDTAFAIIGAIRECTEIPVVILTYYNIVYRRGVARFYAEARSAGADGVLVVDLPLEEADEVLRAALASGIDPVFLIAPTTTPERIRRISATAGGFLYLVSRTGVTGARSDLSPETIPLIARVKQCTNKPVAVGFGISSPAQAARIGASDADGVIIGSALVDLIERNLSDQDRMVEEIGMFVAGVKTALLEQADTEP